MLLYSMSSFLIQKMKVLGATILVFVFFSLKDSPKQYSTTIKADLPRPKSKTTIKKTSSKIENYMSPLLCDGFVYPVGNKTDGGSYKGRFGFNRKGWDVTCTNCGSEKYGFHCGEVWDALEGPNQDLNEFVFSIGNGIVYKIESNQNKGASVGIQHVYLENGKFDTVYSVYKNINLIQESELKIESKVKKGQPIGSIGSATKEIPSYLHIEIRKKEIKDSSLFLNQSAIKESWVKKYQHQVSEFINSKSKLTCPHLSEKLFIAIKSKYKLYHIEQGKIIDTIEIALGQNPLFHKIREGDNRTPEGEYRFIQKAKGPFSGTVGPYFGPRWIRINYPNSYDAENGFINGRITKKERDQIQTQIKNGEQPLKNTALGGGIGIHGWNGAWDVNGHRNITWGCISINNSDLLKFYNKVNIGDIIFISD